MDEPTDGLDPNQKHEMRTLIREMGKTKAIIFSTHILEEVEAACSRAIIIDRGRIVANGTPEELKRRSQHAGAVTLQLLDGDAGLVRQKLDQISLVEKTILLSESPTAVRAYAKGNAAPHELARSISALAAAERWKIQELHTEEGRLDEVFRSITQPEAKPRDSV
jgi:ABC-2 type transport system ATP-binding protein